MRDLDDALADISAIRTQIARSSLFQGYGPATVAGTGALAIAAALAQAALIPAPLAALEAYLALWIGTACVGMALAGAEMIVRARRLHGDLASDTVQVSQHQTLNLALVESVQSGS